MSHSIHIASSSRETSFQLATTCILVASFVLSACSSINKSDTNSREFAIDTKLLSTAAGISWRYGAKTGFVVNIRENDGVNRDISWLPETLSDIESFRKLRNCFEQAKEKIRFADEEIREAPGFYGLLINKCAEYASLNVFNDVRLADQREFDVWMAAGNAYKHMPYMGAMVGTTGSPLLGAKRKIRQLGDDSDAAKSASDVKECVNTAADKGVFETMTMTGGEMSYSSASIQPFLKRLDKCLRDRNYHVE